MDFSQLISQAYQITRKNKVLWIFGIITAVFGSSPQFFNLPFNYSINFSDSEYLFKGPGQMFPRLEFLRFIDSSVWILFGLAALLSLLIFIFVFVYLQIWSSTALISQTLNVVKGKKAILKQGAAAGERFFWRVLGFRMLFGLMVIPATLLLAIPPLLFFVAGLKTFTIIFVAVDIVIFMIGIFIYAVVVGIISEFGLRFMIEWDLRIVDSVKEGLYLFRNNLGKSLLIWFVNVALGFILVIPFLFFVFIFFIFGLVLFFASPWLIILAILGFLVSMVVVSGLWSVFIFSYWSLAYQKLNLELKSPS